MDGALACRPANGGIFAKGTETVLIDSRACRGEIASLGAFDRLAAVFCLNTFTSLAHLK